MNYSIVIPVFKSQNVVSNTVEQLLKVIKDNNFKAEILLINDGSPDESWKIISKLARDYENVKAINLLKNYGQHNAIMCGFQYAGGNYVITMDDDLQNPPGEITKLIEKIEDSECDLVFGQFIEKKHAIYRNLGSKLVGYLNNKIFKKPENIVLSNFRIIRKDLIDRVLSHRTAYPYVPGLLLLYSGNMANVLVQHQARHCGKSNYTIRRILSLVSRLLINYSSYPLRLVSGIGLLVAASSFFIGVFFLLHGIIYGSNVPGWTSLAVLISFLGGFIIALLALIGEYLSRILNQLSSNNMYHIKEIIE